MYQLQLQIKTQKWSLTDMVKGFGFGIMWSSLLVIIIAFAATLFFKLTKIQDFKQEMVVIAVALVLPVCIILTLCIRKYILLPNQLTWRDIGFEPIPMTKMGWLIIHIVLFWALVIAVQTVALFLMSKGDGTLTSPITKSFIHMSLIMKIFIYICIAVFVPISEEIIFRGIVFNYLQCKYKFVVASIVSALIFAVIHFIPPLLPGLFVMGLASSYLFRLYKSIYAPIVFHSVVNSIHAIIVLIAL